jgi:NADPH:quinone reductase-like Zn-dependent oxidoreductase
LTEVAPAVRELYPGGVDAALDLVGTSTLPDTLPREAFQEILGTVAAGRLAFPVDRVYDGLEQVPQAHDDMEHDRATGKLVVRVRH